MKLTSSFGLSETFSNSKFMEVCSFLDLYLSVCGTRSRLCLLNRISPDRSLSVEPSKLPPARRSVIDPFVGVPSLTCSSSRRKAGGLFASTMMFQEASAVDRVPMRWLQSTVIGVPPDSYGLWTGVCWLPRRTLFMGFARALFLSAIAPRVSFRGSEFTLKS